MTDAPARSLSLHVASPAPRYWVSRSLPASATPCLHVALAPCGVCIVSYRAVTTEGLPSSELELINDSQWRWLLTEIVQRVGEHGISGSKVNDGIPPCLQWALDETPLQYCPKEKRMHVAHQSKQCCLRTSDDKRQLTATPCVSRSGEVVCMQIISKGKTARSHADMSERTMKSLLVQWVNAWRKETRTAQQTVMSWEMVLREVPIADPVDAILEPPCVILLVPPEQDAPAIPFNQHVIEPADEATDREPEPKAPAAPEAPATPAALGAPQRAPLVGLPSRGQTRARQAVDCEVRTAERPSLLHNSNHSDSSDFAELSAYVDVSSSES